MTRLKKILVLVALVGAFGLNDCFAQTWPTRPVTLVVTFAAGSGDDVLTRIISPHLSEGLGQQFLVENVGGAGGMNGASRVARAAPDGYEAVIGGTGTFAANQTLYKHPSYDAVMDFTPVGLVAEQPLILATRKDFPADNLQQFIAYAKANHDNLRFASGKRHRFRNASRSRIAQLFPWCRCHPCTVPLDRHCHSGHARRPHRLRLSDCLDGFVPNPSQTTQGDCHSDKISLADPARLSHRARTGTYQFRGLYLERRLPAQRHRAWIVAKFNDALLKTLDKAEAEIAYGKLAATS